MSNLCAALCLRFKQYLTETDTYMTVGQICVKANAGSFGQLHIAFH